MNIVKHEGLLYKNVKELPLTDIAKLIRADIKELVRAGELPKLDYRVKTNYYSGGGSIRILVTKEGCCGRRLNEYEKEIYDYIENIKLSYQFFEDGLFYHDYWRGNFIGRILFPSSELRNES